MAKWDGFDFISFKKKLDSISKGLTSAIEELSPNAITALSWNLTVGSTEKKAYDFIVPQRVGDINPDVVLLQQVDNDMARSIASMCHLVSGRSYHSAGEENVRVLYDSKVFNLLQNSEEIGTGPGTSHYVAATLRHKDRGMQITFMSFQSNPTDECDSTEMKQLATAFCEIVSRTAHERNTLVVAGVDLNFFANIPNGTPERVIFNSGTHQLILSDAQAKPDFKTLNIIPSTDRSFKEAYNDTHYQKSLKHVNPLLCSLSI